MTQHCDQQYGLFAQHTNCTSVLTSKALFYLSVVYVWEIHIITSRISSKGNRISPASLSLYVCVFVWWEAYRHFCLEVFWWVTCHQSTQKSLCVCKK